MDSDVGVGTHEIEIDTEKIDLQDDLQELHSNCVVNESKSYFWGHVFATFQSKIKPYFCAFEDVWFCFQIFLNLIYNL